MIHWRSGTVVSLTGSWPGCQELRVRLEGGEDGEDVPALALTELVGEPVPGDRVLLNTSALRRRLGTGGHALVVALPDRLPVDPPEQPGHIVKARYSPLQTMVCALEEQESEHHEALALPRVPELHGTPVVVAELHSALPAVVAGIRDERPDARVVYVMTDSAALPLAYSRTVAGLVEAGWLSTTITAGQAWGGEQEAITLHNALGAAREIFAADVVVVAQGPGNAGSASTWGFSGIASADALNAVHVLGGRAVAALRVSGADPRARHRGLSHHTMTAIGRVALGELDVVVPRFSPEQPELATLGTELWHDAEVMVHGSPGRPTLREVETDGLDDALAACPVPLRTMGRGLDEDPAAFLTTAAAGRYAARLLP